MCTSRIDARVYSHDIFLNHYTYLFEQEKVANIAEYIQTFFLSTNNAAD